MDISLITDFIVNQGVWCGLFVWLFYNSREENKTLYAKTKEESNAREERLLSIIDSHSKALADISSTLKLINEDIEDIKKTI